MSELAAKIASKIPHQGSICFADFMNIALYCPLIGYYEGEKDIVGTGGDYYTSVSAGAVFGKLMAYQIFRWLHEKPFASHPGRWRIVEVGAHRGQLAKDILGWLEAHSHALLDRIDYWIVEPSLLCQKAQVRTLAAYARHVSWAADLNDLRVKLPEGVNGVFLSNELLDAMPVHRVAWDKGAHAWTEWGVGFENSRFIWRPMPGLCSEAAFNPMLARLPEELLRALPPGFATELGMAAIDWWAQAARLLRLGLLVTFDYGLEWDQFFEPQRAAGTLRGYRHHTQVADVLQDPGLQDITAHINFTAIREAGEREGLRTVTQKIQSRFLIEIAKQYWEERLPLWTSRELRHFRTIVHPEGLGRALRVLVQERS